MTDWGFARRGLGHMGSLPTRRAGSWIPRGATIPSVRKSATYGLGSGQAQPERARARCTKSGNRSIAGGSRRSRALRTPHPIRKRTGVARHHGFIARFEMNISSDPVNRYLRRMPFGAAGTCSAACASARPPSRGASRCRLAIRGTPDRSKLFGPHGQKPWLHDVVSDPRYPDLPTDSSVTNETGIPAAVWGC